MEEDEETEHILLQYAQYRKRAIIKTIKESDDVVVIGNTFSDGDSYIIRKGNNPFMISTETVDALLKQSQGRAFFAALIGIALILSSLLVAFISFS